MIFVYDCQLFENDRASSVSETIFGEKLPKFVSFLAGTLPL